MEKENEEKAEIKIDEDEKNIIFETAKNFDELYILIKKFSKIIGSGGEEYKPDYLINRVKTVRTEIKDFQEKGGITQLTRKEIKNLIKTNSDLHDLMCRITRSKVLRNRVVNLAIDEIINRAVSKKNKYTEQR